MYVYRLFIRSIGGYYGYNSSNDLISYLDGVTKQIKRLSKAFPGRRMKYCMNDTF